MVAARTRPLPVADAVSAPYWEAARRHRLVLQRCGECAAYQFPPLPACRSCHSTAVAWVEVSGRGTVFTFTVMHDTLIPGLEPPYVVALVAPEEAPALRITANILECSVAAVRIGMPVGVCFQDLGGVTLPQFRPRDRAR